MNFFLSLSLHFLSLVALVSPFLSRSHSLAQFSLIDCFPLPFSHDFALLPMLSFISRITFLSPFISWSRSCTFRSLAPFSLTNCSPFSFSLKISLSDIRSQTMKDKFVTSNGYDINRMSITIVFKKN